MPTINVMLPSEPAQGEDPLKDFLDLTEVRKVLESIGLDPENHDHIEMMGSQSFNIHFPEGDVGLKVSALLDRYRDQYGYTTGSVIEDPPEHNPDSEIQLLSDED